MTERRQASLDCPDCGTHLKPFWVPARAGAEELELDRCNECGGVWFDAGELHRASGRTVAARAEETDRACPLCHLPLREGTMTGGVEVETCRKCRGTFLEARDMDALVKKAPERRAPGGTGFVCDGCGERKPFSQAQPTLTGLECAACAQARAAPPPSDEKKEATSLFGRFAGWLRGEE